MQLIPLAGTGRVTTRLGFGGSSLMGTLNLRQSLALLETAYDCGIRHFDTAPSYGYGESESCLGKFLERHRSDCTVTTKFGIPRPRNQPAIRLARAIARPAVQRLPALKSRLQAAMQRKPSAAAATPDGPNPIFKAQQARASIEISLRNLRTARIDLLLLHEVRAIDLAADPAADALLEMLESLVAAGTVGAFGVGSELARIGELQAQHPRYCPVLQYDWSIFNDEVASSGSFRVHHRSLSTSFPALVAKLQSEPALRKRLSTAVGEDVGDPAMLANLMLKASLVKNPDSIILFSSKHAGHIRNNVAVTENTALEGPAQRLYDAWRRERSCW